MDWNKLKQERCPKCGAGLYKVSTYLCSCGFRISYGKAYNVVGKPENLERLATELIKKSLKKKQ